MADSPHPAPRDTLLQRTRRRLTRLEVEVHRLRAELARLEARGEDEAARRLAVQLREEERRLALAPDDAELLSDSSVDAPQPAPTDFVGLEAATRPSLAPRSQSGGTTAQKSRTRRKKRQKRSLLSAPAWVVSLVAHGALLTMFGAVGFATLQDRPDFLLANAYEAPGPLEPLAEIPLETPDAPPLETEETVDLPPPLEFKPLLSEPLARLAPSAQPAPPGAVDAMLADLAGMTAGDAGSGAAVGGAGEGGAATGGAQFFGARSSGERIVYVVDNSGSMVDGRMETTLMELTRSVRALKPQQHFHVLFYSDQAYPMFFPEPVAELTPATRENKRRLERWLATVEMCRGGALSEAMDLAAALEPDVVYLLSDGDYLFLHRGGRREMSSTLKRLTEPNDWPFVIHTLGMTVRDAEDAEALAMVARAHGGVFRHVSVRPVAAHMARERPIPYHKERGAVWGAKVR